MKTALMVSVANGGEARAALEGGAALIDVKNPREGALGAPSPGTLSDVRRALEGGRPLSVALGEFPGKPGAAALTALGAMHFRPDYIKIAFLPQSPVGEIGETLAEIRRAVPASLIAAAYADRVGEAAWSLEDLAECAAVGGFQGCLIDTWEKNGSSLFAHLSEEEVGRFVDACRRRGLLCALAGSLDFSHIPALRRLRPDIVGTRTAVCGGDRLNGSVSAALVEAFRERLAA